VIVVLPREVAHVYVQHPERVAEVKRLLAGLAGMDTVLDEAA